MSINVGSNFLYQGKKHLDDRQNKAKTIKDLKTWNIPVPDGFEVCVDGSWYVYDSRNSESEITGKFRKRTEITQNFGNDTEKAISQAVVTEKFEEVDKDLTKLISSVFPLEFKSISGGGNFEIGKVVIPKISWAVNIKGEADLVKPEKAFVNNSTEGVGKDLVSFIGEEITMNTPGTVPYKILVEYKNLNTTQTVNYNFFYQRYYGTSSKTSLETLDILNLSNKSFTKDSYKLPPTKFDCTGGKYPYYVIPKALYNSNLEFWVGGLKNTDLVIKDVNVITNTGLEIVYTTIRLSNIQTGILSIEIK